MQVTNDVAGAVRLLRAGGIVAFPTETVYGLGADAVSPAAVARVFAAKGRPAHHPLIVHLGAAGALDDWARDVPPMAYTLARRFWPGPLTLVLRRAARVPDAVTGGLDTVGLRVPAHPVALELLAAFGGGLAAPSANAYGRVSPTRAEDVALELGERVDMVLDGGPCQVGIESTIVDLSRGAPRMLRPGGVTREALEDALGMPLPLERGGPVRAPGQSHVHYAPRARVVVSPAQQAAATARALAARGERVMLFASRDPGPIAGVSFRGVGLSGGAMAHDLYASLRAADREACDAIVVEAPAAEGLGLAIADRLERAAAAHGEGTGDAARPRDSAAAGPPAWTAG